MWLVTWCCVVLGVLGSLLVPATAYCGERGTSSNQCRNITVAVPRKPPIVLVCDIGKGRTQMIYRPNPPDTRFNATDFPQSCLGNAGLACDASANTVDTANPKSDTSCCSCFLYSEYCFGKRNKFTTNKGTSNPHVLLMPTAPCSGVENYNRGSCPGEDVWDAAQQELDATGRDATWGMSINPVSRRGQHQMHIHLAQVYPSLASTLAYAHNSLQLSNFYLDCKLTSSTKLLKQCSILPSTATVDPQYNPQVIISTNINSPARMQPFLLAYTSAPNRQVQNVLWASLLVVRVPFTPSKNTWAAVINRAGPAECFFNSNGDQDLMTACPA